MNYSYILRRFALAFFVILGIITITFTLSRIIIPGDPAYIWAGGLTSDAISQETLDNITQKYHFDEPLWKQYFYYIWGVLHLDLGDSPADGRPVTVSIFRFLPNTITLIIASLIISIGVGIPLGIISAYKRDEAVDHISRLVALVGVSIPAFLLALVLQWTFYYELSLLPPGGILGEQYSLTRFTGIVPIDALLNLNIMAFFSSIKYLILPSVCLGTILMASTMRLTRNSMLDVLSKEYMRTARMKGLRERVILLKHGLKNALIPVITFIGIQFAALFQGVFVVEVIFQYPGIGRYTVISAIKFFDIPAIMAITLMVGVMFVTVNLIIDILYTYLNPEINIG